MRREREGIVRREKGETGMRGSAENEMRGKGKIVMKENGGMRETGEKIGIGDLRGKREKTGRRKMIEIDGRTGTGMMTGARELKESAEMSVTGKKN